MILPSYYNYGKTPHLRTCRRMFQEWEYTLLAANFDDLDAVKLQWSPINVYNGRGQDDTLKCRMDAERLQADPALFDQIFRAAIGYASGDWDYLTQTNPNCRSISLPMEDWKSIMVDDRTAILHQDFRYAKTISTSTGDYYYVIEMTASIRGAKPLRYDATPMETFIL